MPMLRPHLGAVVRSLLSLLVLSMALSMVLQLGPPSAAAAPVADDEIADAFLNRLLDEINARRGNLGTQPLAYVPASVSSALDGYLAAVTPAIAWPGPCTHLTIDGAYSWDFLFAAGYDGEARGEVIACPGPEPYWTPDRTAEQWWESPVHFDVLYADPDANVLACSTYGRGSAYLSPTDEVGLPGSPLLAQPDGPLLAQLGGALFAGDRLLARDKKNNNGTGNGNGNGNGNDNEDRPEPRTVSPSRSSGTVPSASSRGGSSDAALAVLCVTLRS